MMESTNPRYRNATISILAALVLVMTLPAAGPARDDDRDRFEFYGLIEVMPPGLVGTWVIGGQRIQTGPGTEFDQFEGPLQPGGCAKVEIRDGFAHEIDSEPASDCR